MNIRMKCEKPGEIEYTLTVTMKASEWEQFRDQLKSYWPSSKFGEAVTDMLGQARKVYWPIEPPSTGDHQ